jgi:PAS domain S-box-containing protein
MVSIFHSALKTINGWVNHTIQRRLAIWSVGFLLISIGILSLIFTMIGGGRILAETSLRNTQFSSTLSRDISTQISNITGNARTFTQHLAALRPDLETQASSLLELRLSSSRYRALYYFSADNTLLFDLTDTNTNLLKIESPSEIITHPIVPPEAWIMDVSSTTLKEGITISDVHFTTLDYVPVLGIGMTVFFSSGEKRGIVFEVDLSDIWQKIETATVGHTGITYAVSHEGTVIAHPDPSLIGRRIPDVIKPVTENYEGTVKFTDPFTDQQVLAAYSPVGGQTGWGIIVQQDRAEINESINKTIAAVILGLLALGIIGTAGILLLSRGFTRPIQELTKTTKDIANTGTLIKTRIAQRPDEIGQLSHAFDQMIDKVKNTEDKLSISQERYRSLFEHANDAILLLDNNGIIDCNFKAEQMFGAAHSQIVGKLPSYFSPEIQPDNVSSRSKEQTLLTQAFAGQEQRFEWRNRRFNGEIFDAEVSLNRLNINDQPVLMSIIRDITDRKQAEEALKQAQKEKEEAAVIERTRLAHDLHDAVSQTMFSASIIADVLPRLWDKNPEEGRRRLEEIRQLTRGALAEMRTLLFELRPAALADAELGYLLHQLAESITGRSRIPVEVFVEGECDLPADTKVALYRITQEALNNVAKHANAGKALVNMRCKPDELSLVISDNGKGFDLSKVKPESLGLGIMRARIKGIGGQLTINSEPGAGSEIVVKVKTTNKGAKNGG